MGQLKQFLESELMLEYYVSEVSYLKSYLNMNNEEKHKDLAFRFPQYFGKFLESDDDDEDVGDFSDYYQGDGYWDMVSIEIDHPEMIGTYGKWLEGNLSLIDSDNDTWPSWMHMMYMDDVKNQWLIHFSDKAEEIVDDQSFKYGTDTLEELGLTTWRTTGEGSKAHPGYNFAYRLEDYEKYGSARRGSGWKYGKEAVLFRASGVLVSHSGDEEPQVIFYGPTAQHMNRVYQDGDTGKWQIDNIKSGAALYSHEKLSNVVDWFEKNYDQYRGVLH